MPARFFCALALVLATGAGRAAAFDTGHHADLTRVALDELGFDNDAIRSIQVANWLTDLYSAPDSLVTKDEFEKLHFDCVFSTADVANYWKQLAINTKAAAADAARENDLFKFLSILGVSLHTVQDFYTHSNWAEAHPRAGSGDYRTSTFWSAPPGPGVDIHTGWYKNALYPTRPPQAKDEHGDYEKGLNHDAPQRPRWDEAYVFAYAASREWASAVCAWAEEAKPGFVARIRIYQAGASRTGPLDYDFQAAYRVSEWISIPGIADGHWKGPGSGRSKKWLPFLARWKAAPDSPSVLALKDRKYQLLLTKNLYGGAPQGAVPALPRVGLDKVAVSVRTLSVASEGLRPLLPNFYARVLFGESTGPRRVFVEAMQNRYKKSIDTFWWTINFVDRAGPNPIRITYELYNEDEDDGYPLPRPGDEHFSLKGRSEDAKDLTFTYDLRSRSCAGDVSGVHDTPEKAATLKGGASYPAAIRLTVSSNGLAAP